MMKYIQIKNEKELDILKDKTDQFNGITFSFSEKYLQSLKKALNEKNAFQLFVKDGDIFVGHIATSEKEFQPNFLWIIELFVDPKHQRQGIGSLLLEKVIAKAKEMKMSGVFVQTEHGNTRAQNLYKKIGFVEMKNAKWKKHATFRLKF